MTVREVRICVVGDELSVGVGDPRALGWVGRVMARSRFEPPAMLFTLAVPGETTSELGARWDAETASRFGPPAECENRLVVALGRHDVGADLSIARSRYTKETTFPENDHRNYNREGKAFDVGETFSGVDFATGVSAAAEFSALVAALPFDLTPAQAAIAWAWQQPGVSTVIPGARNPGQARANAAAGAVPVLGPLFAANVRELYDTHFRAAIHSRW